ncbi:MAG TPA: hypothetical protein PKD18_07375 [Saprospiraceae bacterium]|nr:hypothetical protein [Saprospiraceae bacterium]
MILLIALAIYQRSKQLSLRPVLVVISLYSICFLINNNANETAAWQWFVETILFR